nr:MAG TPA: hypothetical protein [Caudoviricetes sp.]
MPDRRRPVSRPPTYSAYHAGDTILPLRWQGDYSLTYNPSALGWWILFYSH